MFGMGWSELILIGVIALIVVGPKDLPNMFRAMGQFTGKARTMAREFSRAMEAAADDAGVKDVQKTLRAAANPTSFGTDKLKEAAKTAVKPPDRGLKSKSDEPTAAEKAKAAAAERQAAREAEIAEMEAEATADEVDHADAPSSEPEPQSAKPVAGATGTTKDE
jgi:sec-independent protein translocase protein TatB